MLKVAVASNDGITIDEHFGRAESFLVYEVAEDGTSRFLERRSVAAAGDGEAAGHRSDAAIELLNDVNAVLAVQVGPGSEGALTRRGIRSFALKGPIEKAVSSYGRRHRFLDSTVPGLPAGYEPERRCGCSSAKKGCKG